MEDLLAAKGEVVKRIDDVSVDTIELTPEDIVGRENLAALTGSGEGQRGTSNAHSHDH